MNRHQTVILFALLSLVSFTGACRPDPDVAPVVRSCASGELCVTGTVAHIDFEGGFWAIRGDDRVTYDPMGGLPVAFQHEGLRVHLVARPRPDMASFHMAGPIVEIVSIERAK